MEVFISYSTKDSTIANAVCAALENSGIGCFIAPRDIHPGLSYASEIIRGVNEVKAFLVIISSSSNASEHVANEVEIAFNAKKTIIPFFVENVPMSLELKYYLSRKHWLIAYPHYEQQLPNLVKVISELLGVGDVPPSSDKDNNIKTENGIANAETGKPDGVDDCPPVLRGTSAAEGVNDSPATDDGGTVVGNSSGSCHPERSEGSYKHANEEILPPSGRQNDNGGNVKSETGKSDGVDDCPPVLRGASAAEGVNDSPFTDDGATVVGSFSGSDGGSVFHSALKYDIFISYSRYDTAVVKKFTDKIGAAGYEYWMDVDGVESGDEFKRKIVSAIKDSKVFLFFSSKDSNSSPWTVKEVNIAVMLHKPIIPIRLDNAVYDDSLLFDLAGLDFIECSSDDRISSGIQKLMRSLKNKTNSCNNGDSDSVTVENDNTGECYSKNVDETMLLYEGVEKENSKSKKPNSERLVVEMKRSEEELQREHAEFDVSNQQIADVERKGITNTVNSINGHNYVDLGLSVKWSTCNVGASKPESYGNHYAWGEVETKDFYSDQTYIYAEKKNFIASLFVSKYKYNILGENISGTEYDVARKMWGSPWRLPTVAEFQELIYNCTWEWSTRNGHNGYKVTSKKNGNSIFLPAAGWHRGKSSGSQGSSGYYWSATPIGNDTGGAYDLYFDEGSCGTCWGCRFGGHSVRPVSE